MIARFRCHVQFKLIEDHEDELDELRPFFQCVSSLNITLKKPGSDLSVRSLSSNSS